MLKILKITYRLYHQTVFGQTKKEVVSIHYANASKFYFLCLNTKYATASKPAMANTASNPGGFCSEAGAVVDVTLSGVAVGVAVAVTVGRSPRLLFGVSMSATASTITANKLSNAYVLFKIYTSYFVFILATFLFICQVFSN